MQDSAELEVLSVTTTVGSLADGQALARQIMAHRLAACVQIEHGVTSFYRWQGEQHEDAEVRMVIKTTPGREAALQEFFTQHHPYDLPQFLVTRMRASEAYATWVRAETSGPTA